MGIFLRKEVGKNGKLGIWHITESVEELLSMIPRSIGTKKDLSAQALNPNERRRKEWLVARILAEQLTGEKDIRIIYDEHKKPFLENSKKHISLSHSRDLLAVITDEAETGIDIELIKPKVVRIKEKFMSGEELGSLQENNQEEQLTIYWCAKESLYKLYGKKELHFKENILIDGFTYNKEGIVSGRIVTENFNHNFHLAYLNLDDFMLAYVLP